MSIEKRASKERILGISVPVPRHMGHFRPPATSLSQPPLLAVSSRASLHSAEGPRSVKEISPHQSPDGMEPLPTRLKSFSSSRQRVWPVQLPVESWVQQKGRGGGEQASNMFRLTLCNSPTHLYRTCVMRPQSGNVELTGDVKWLAKVSLRG